MQTSLFRPEINDPLQACLFGIFRFRASEDDQHELILPKGNVDILFNLGGPLSMRGPRIGSHRVETAQTRVAGLQTGALVSCSRERSDLLGISLRVETCSTLLQLPMHELTDQSIDAEAVFPELRGLGEKMLNTQTFSEQCAELLRWLACRFQPTSAAGMVQHACASLRESSSASAVNQAAEVIGCTPRHLGRLFKRHIGISPSRYLRLRRFIDAIHLATAPEPSLTTIAHEARFYDQAHFCKEFRHFAGITPQEFRQSKSGAAVGHLFLP